MSTIIEFLYTKTPLAFLTQSFWRDEAFTVLLSKKPLMELLTLTAKDFNPPLYYLIAKIWIKIFGQTEIVLRSLSFLFYTFSIYFFSLILEKLSTKKKTFKYYLTLFVFATLPINLYYAFEFRMYSLLLLLTLISYYSLITNKPVWYFLSTTAGLFTHYFFAFNLIAQFVWIQKKLSKNKKKIFIKRLFLSFAVFVAWLSFVFYSKWGTTSISFWIEKPTLKDIFLSPFYLVGAYDKNWEPLHKNASIFTVFFWFLIFLVLKNKTKEKENDLIKFWLAIPFLLSLAISKLTIPIFLPRYLIFITPPLLLGIYLIKNKRIALALLIATLFFNFHYNGFLIKNKKKTDWRTRLYELKRLLKKNTFLYITSPEDYPVFVYYTSNEKVYIYNKTYESIPEYIGKVIIPKDKLTTKQPIFPKKAIIIQDFNHLMVITTK